MKFFDPFILVIFCGFVFYGLVTGLIQTLGSIFGMFLGAFLAGQWYDNISGIFGLADNQIANIIAFIAIFFVIMKLVGLIFLLINKVFKIIAIVPGLKFLNRIGGMILGTIEGAFFIGICLNFIARFAEGTFFEDLLISSGVSKFFINITNFIMPLLPEAVEKLQSVIK